MTPDKTTSSMTSRQKITAILFVIILIFLAWQIYGLFKGGGSAPAPAPSPTSAISPGPAGTNAQVPNAPNMVTPKVATLAKTPPAPLTEREQALLLLQQQTEAKYISAINELQMLKVERDIAETNRAIMNAKFDTINSQKKIVDLFKPPTQPVVTQANYAQGLVGSVPGATTPATTQTQTTTTVQAIPTSQAMPDVNYVVVSVSQLQGRWSAVLGSQGNLYNVFLGDVIPLDRSRVVSIDRSGVVLEKNGLRRKFSLVPII